MKNFFKFLVLIFAFSLLSYSLRAGDSYSDEDIKTMLPKMLGANNVGKEFWFTIPPCLEDESYGYANFVKIYVTSPYRTLVKVEVPGKSFLQTKMTIPNDVIEFSLNPTVAQCYTRSYYTKENPDDVFIGSGINVVANDPIVVYAVVRYRYTSDGFLAIPVSSLGKEYIAAGYPVDPMFENGGVYIPGFVGITAAYDQTTVRVTIGGNAYTKTAGGLRAGQTVQKVLNRGDVYLISTQGQASDLTGTKIIANKPVAVVTGNQCTNIPNGNRWCDYTVEMDLPTFTWGYDYHVPNVPKLPKRKKPSLLRIFAKEKGTTLYRDGREFAYLKANTGFEGDGWLETRMNVGVPDYQSYPVVISGNKPISVTLYNTGVEEDGYPRPNSDPFVMAMTPYQQYQKEITFCTPATFGGQRFAENYLGLVYQTDEYGMCPDHIEFAEVKSGQFVWKKVNVLFPGVDDIYRYDVDGKKYAYKVITLAKDGVYKIRAKTPFACYSYGFDSFDSYGYPTSAALADLEKPDTLPPDPKWRDSCGVISFATVTDMPDDPTIRSNMAMIVLHPYPESYNVDFKYTDFIPGEARTVPWRLEVVDKTQDARAVITFSDRRGNDTTIVIEYKAVKLTIRPNFADWGLLKQNSGRVSKEFWVINENEQSAALVTSLQLKSRNQYFEIDMLGRSLPFWLGPKDSVKILVWFDPVENGTFADSIGVGDTCVFAYKTRVQASVGQPIIEVSDINFGSVTVGNTVAREFAIRNSGTTDLHIWGYTGPTNAIVYKATTLPPVDINNRLANEIVVKPGQEVRYTVEFTPDAERDYPDQIIFFSDAAERDSICDLYGIGIKPGLESNSYNWGRKRIDRASHPAGPYPVPSGDVIKLRNTGTQEVHISGLIVVEDVNGDAFEFDRNVFNNLKLQPGEETVIPVVFHPTKVGEHRLRLKFQNTANSDAETILEGIGIVGQLETIDLTFDPMVIFDDANKQTKTMYIENKSYQWEDSVVITDLVVNPAGAIAEDGTSYGTEGFGYDKAALDLPVVLQPGQRLYLDAYFVAQKVQPTSATLTTVSDAIAEVTSTWSGSGISRGIRSTGGSAKICVGDRAEITCRIENPAQGELTVNRLYFNGDFEGIAFLNPADALGFKIPAGGSREVKIVYQPTKVEKKQIWLMIENNTLDKNPDSCAIDVEAVQYKGTARLNVVAPQIGRAWPAPGDKIPVSIEFSTSDNLILAQVKELEVTVKYKPGLLKVDQASIEVGSILEGRFTVQDLKIDDVKGEMTLRLVATGTNILNGSGQILRFKFDSFLPTAEVGSDYSTLEVNVEAMGTQCLLVDDIGSEVKLVPTCVYDLRWIATTANQYYLGAISPNPVKNGAIDVNFGVAFDGWTEIVIINTKGEVVKRVTTGQMRAGDYTVRVDVNDLPNGMYIITMASEHFRQKQEFVITR